MKANMNGVNLKRKLNRVALKPLRMLMRRQDMSQNLIARKMNMDIKTLRKYIRDPRKMNDYQIELMARAIGVKKEEIQKLIVTNHKHKPS